MSSIQKKLAEKRLVRELRTQQVDLLKNQSNYEQLRSFYTKIVDNINEGKIQKLDAYTLFTDLFEDCPESQLQQNFDLFQSV